MSLNLFDVQHFSVQDGPGIRTTFFLKGCPLRCRWCHNPEGQSGEFTLRYREELCIGCRLCEKACPRDVHGFAEGSGHTVDFAACVLCGRCVEACPSEALTVCGFAMTPGEVLAEALTDIHWYGEKGGVTFSGGEPLSQASAVAEAARLLTENGIRVCVDTCGDVPYSAFEGVLPYTQKFLYDIKGFNSARHSVATGRGNERILDNLRRLCADGAAVWIRVPVIPVYNDDPEDFGNIADFLRDLPGIERVTLMPYHTLGKSKYGQVGLEAPAIGAPPGKDEMREYREIFSSRGLNVD